jgi:hypothetical protein
MRLFRDPVLSAALLGLAALAGASRRGRKKDGPVGGAEQDGGRPGPAPRRSSIG